MNICCTGISQGLGKALTKELLARGHAVWGIARNTEKLQLLENELASPHLSWTQADVTSEASLMHWREEMQKQSFVPDCLILNASIQEDDLKAGYDHAAGTRTLRTNLEGALACIALFLPDFLRKRRGRIIAIGSTVTLRPSVRSAAYAASKAGLSCALRTLRLRYAHFGISFAEILLGPLATEMWEGKRNWLVPTPEKAAPIIAKFVVSKRKVLYYPRLTVAMLRTSLYLPDSVFACISSRLLK